MIIIIIPAKGESTRLPRKNMVALGGRPMLDWTIDDALASQRAAAVYVSTDDDEIAAHAAKRGIKVIRRPQSLGGEVPILEVYRHALTQIPDSAAVQILVGLQPDHPDRDLTVDETIAMLEAEQADRVMSKDAQGIKHGGHYVLSRHFVTTGESRKDVVLVDDCTNIHFPADLERAESRLAGRKR